MKTTFASLLKKTGLPDLLRRASTGQKILWGAGLLAGAVLFSLSWNIWACWTVTSLPGIPPARCTDQGSGPPGTPAVDDQGTPVSAPATPVAPADLALPPSWDGASRVNLLFIGLDFRDTELNEGPPRSDTMILFTIDPQSRTAGILSIQRDLWVNIPGFGSGRINTAYPLGESNNFPGGGPGLAMKTVEQFIGVPIQYYGQIDFYAFEEAIDAMGGLSICIPERVRIDPIGNKPPTNLHAGCQTLHGFEVLAYARNRYTAKDDVDRSNRQQLVIMALRDQIFDPANFPSMLAKAPEIYQEASGGLRTNLSFEDAMKLGVLLQQIPTANIRRGVIDYSMVTIEDLEDYGGARASVLKPIADKIRVLRDEIFTASGPASPLARGEAAALMQADAARVRVLNGSGDPDLASRAAAYFQSQGMTVTETGTADSGYGRSVVVLYAPKLYTAKYFMAMFGIGGDQIIFRPDPASPVDVEVRLGNDAAGVIP